MSQQRRQMRRADHAQRLHRRRFVRIGSGHDQLANVRIARQSRRDRKRSADRRDSSIERELADENASGNVIFVKELGCLQDSEGDGQIESGTFFFHIGGREIDGDVTRRQPEAAVMQRGADARVGLADGGIGKTDECEAGLRRLRGVDFDGDAHRVDA